MAYVETRRFALEPGDYAFGEWLAEFESCAAHRDGDELIGMSAGVDRMGSSAIYATILRDGEEIELSPYFNQLANDCGDDCYERFGDEDCEGNCTTEADEIENDESEWLVVMAGATQWYEWDWSEV